MIVSEEYVRLHYPDRDAMPACAGEHELFDPPEPHEPQADHRERAALARKVCHWCPILDDCAEFAASLTNRARRGFTYAGITYNAAGNPTTDSTKENAE